MGKKVSQTSLKISKKEKKEFNSLIRLLRPKVYITDSSSFKRLVQDLTGNGASNPNTSSSSLHPQKKHNLVDEEQIPVVHIVDDQDREDQGDTEGSLDASTDTSTLDDYSFQDLESWLLDTDHPYDPFFNNGFAQIDQQVSIYDYELSGLLSLN